MSSRDEWLVMGGGLVLILVLLVVAFGVMAPNVQTLAHGSVGEPAPPIELELLDGGRFTLADHRGQDIVILDFWATWCGPCLRAMPALIEVAEEYADRGVVLYAIDLREPPEVVRGLLADRGWEGLNVPLDTDGAVANAYGVTGIPHTVIVGRDGIIQGVHIGYSSRLKRDLSRKLDTLLADGTLVESGNRGLHDD